MAFVYVPKKNVVSVWRPVEFTVSGGVDVGLCHVNVFIGGNLKSDPQKLFRSFYVSNPEKESNITRFKIDVSPYLREGIEPYDRIPPATLGTPFSYVNEMYYELDSSSIAYRVEVKQLEKNANGVYVENGVVDRYPSANNAWAYGVNHSPVNNEEDMYMTKYYPISGRCCFLSDWKKGANGTVLKCGFNEALFASFWIGDGVIEGVRLKRTQINGVITTGIYDWRGVISDGSNENNKVIAPNIGISGINGVFNAGQLAGLLYGDPVFIDSDTDSYEVQYIKNFPAIQIVNGTVEPNIGTAIGFTGYEDVTETIRVNTEFCENELFKRVFWMNKRGGMDSKTFRMFARRSNKVKSVKNRKALFWDGGSITPNNINQRTVSRKDIESDVMYEVEDLVENEEALFLEDLLKSPCVYMLHRSEFFLALDIEDGEISPSDTDDGFRVVKLKFTLDNTNIPIE